MNPRKYLLQAPSGTASDCERQDLRGRNRLHTGTLLPYRNTRRQIDPFGGADLNPTMKRIAIAAVSVVAFLAILVAAIPFIVPDSFLRDRIAARVSTWTGRTVTINGDPSLSLYPSLAITVGDLTVSNPETMGDEAFISAASVRATMPLLPLIFGRTEFDQFELIEPRIRLVTDKAGENNWRLTGGRILAQAQQAASGDNPPAEAPPADPAAVATPVSTPPRDVRVGTIRILNGTIVLDDLATERREELSGVNAEFSWPTAAAVLSGTGTFTWRGERVDANAVFTRPLMLLAGKNSPVRAALASTGIRISLQGDVGAGMERFSGRANITTPSLRRVLTWLGTPLEAGPTLGAVAVDGAVKVENGAIAFENAAIEFDGNRAVGDLALDVTLPRPRISATLTMERLDLSAYFEAARVAVTSGSWLVTPTSLPIANVLDADVRVTAGEMLLGTAHIDNLAGSATLDHGAATIAIDDGQLAGGFIRGRVEARMVEADFVASATAEIADVETGTALEDTAGIDVLSGRAGATLSIGSRGKTWGELARNIAGTLIFSVRDGTLAGVDLAAAAEALAVPGAEPIQPTGSTAFTRMAANVEIREADLITRDLAIEGPDASALVAGRGSILNGLIDGTATISSGGDTVPVTITGRWRAPTLAREEEDPAAGIEPAAVPTVIPTVNGG